MTSKYRVEETKTTMATFTVRTEGEVNAESLVKDRDYAIEEVEPERVVDTSYEVEEEEVELYNGLTRDQMVRKLVQHRVDGTTAEDIPGLFLRGVIGFHSMDDEDLIEQYQMDMEE